MLPPADSRDSVKEVHRLHAQRMRQFDNVQQGDIAFPALDAAHIVPVEFGKLSETLLRESTLLPQLADTLAEDCSRIGTSHPMVMLDC